MTVAHKAMNRVAELVRAVVPGAVVKVAEPSPVEVGSGGYLTVSQGDPPQDEPELLIGMGYQHERDLLVTIFLAETDDGLRSLARDELVGKVVGAIEADPTLGGLVQVARPFPPSFDLDQTPGGVPLGVAQVPCQISYFSSSSAG